ncbi:hypothetical protein ACE1CI_22615 [Aerosakkonemataceae cyanobacterium BLCC-F50]|uniref:Uncharacterized protein n=1 Tax=Floridaenema flaviceps BLCC-F50 TaxID=3153642 RepID=A0ABV4XVF1_9CYAN
MANSWPPMAIGLLQIPLITGIVTYGFSLIAIVILEAIIFSQKEAVSLSKAIVYTALANFCSLMMGVIIIIGISGLPYGATWLPLGIGYSILLLFSTQTFPITQNLSLAIEGWIFNLFAWGIIWFCGLFCSVFLLITVGAINPDVTAGKPFPDWDVPFYINIVQLLGVVGFMGLGFAMSIVSEAFCLTKLLKNSSKQIKRTILIMNVRSYAYIALPITIVMKLKERIL